MSKPSHPNTLGHYAEAKEPKRKRPRKLTLSECQVTLNADYDNCVVRGNAMASGDDAADKECEDEILSRLERGDLWAWACVEVIVQWQDFKGRAVLGCCSYESEAAFREDAYFTDMQTEALEDLNTQIEAAYNQIRELF